MKIFLIVGLLIGTFTSSLLCNGSLKEKVKYTSVEKGNQLLMQEDDYTKNWSQFDIDSRMQKKNSSKAELFEFIKKQTREWTSSEKNTLDSIFDNIDKLIKKNGFNIDFPDEIYIVKTTAKDEGGAFGFTRANYIVLKDDAIYSKQVDLTHLVLHELFHVLSRKNPEFRKEMYSLIGFRIMESVDYPESIKQYRISNPDATQTDSYISLKVGEQSVDCMMIMYSKRDYDGGVFFNYVNIGFLSLVGEEVKTIDYVDNKAVIYEINQVSGFFEQVGMNTQYIINPEEIMAENFSLAILGNNDLPNQEIVEKIKVVLKKCR